MRRILLKVAYDGTNYNGWQKQPDVVTIEGTINETLSRILEEDISIIGASRTDAGVHALCNIAVFDTNTSIPAEKIAFALNRRLPRDIVIQESREVPLDFHPRDSESIKTYEYTILNTKFPLPTKRLYSYHVHKDINIEAMKEAAKYLEGTHDYKSFCLAKTQVYTTVRTVYSITIDKEGDIIKFTFKGNGFLYNMVRCIVGTLVYVGRGVYPPEYVKEILEKRDRQEAGPNAPAQGLILANIEYVNKEELIIREDKC
ncbi:MAG: tRNA pseudouridine(38-40) synthase TruA [Clostridiales bacterium]|nr:tRNA pseudouridine(38-40) synthase TruA [Clostridiales bacterium]